MSDYKRPTAQIIKAATGILDNPKSSDRNKLLAMAVLLRCTRRSSYGRSERKLQKAKERERSRGLVELSKRVEGEYLGRFKESAM